MNTNSLIRNQEGFPDGIHSILTLDDATNITGIEFTSIKLHQDENHTLNYPLEVATLLMTGRVKFTAENKDYLVERTGYFEQNPIVLHCPSHTEITISALTDCEILIMATANEKTFPIALFDSTSLLEADHRGKNLLENTSYRLVRTVFDKRNRPESNLIVGEIITFQGHWSSYPPHHHPQPEVYHYRFSEPQGFAFGECGEEVLRLRHYDTYQIAPGDVHAHCTAPGYALYTLWFIRHLPNNPYYQPTFQAEHNWTRDPAANSRIYAEKKEEGI